jgi:hypothetical protein
MARVTIAAGQQVTSAGLAPALTAPTVDGDSIPSGQTLLWVENASGAPITVTVQTPATMSGLAVAEAGGAVPAAGRRFFGPFPKGTFGQPAGQTDVGMVRVDYSAVASVTRGVFVL